MSQIDPSQHIAALNRKCIYEIVEMLIWNILTLTCTFFTKQSLYFYTIYYFHGQFSKGTPVGLILWFTVSDRGLVYHSWVTNE